MSAYRRRDDAVAIANRIVVFVPRTIDDAVWERVGPWVRSTVTAADPAIDSQATTLLKALAHLAAWAYEHAIPIETEAVLQPEVLERYRLTGMRRLSARSRSAEMSRLRRVARVVTQRAPWPAPNERGPRGPLSPPYSDDEVRQFWRDAELQHSLFRRHAMNALLALTLGVGVRPRELFLPTADHIEMVDDVMAVRIPGNHARVVPVRRECVDQIRIAAVTAPRGPLVGSGRTGRDRAAALIATFELAPAAPAAADATSAVDLASRRPGGPGAYCRCSRDCRSHNQSRHFRPRTVLAGVLSGFGSVEVARGGARGMKRSVEEVIDLYQAVMPADRWARIGPLVRDSVRRALRPDSQLPSPKAVAGYMGIAAAFVAWTQEMGYDLDVEILFSPSTIAHYIAIATPQLAGPTKATRRATLSMIGRRITRRADWGAQNTVYPVSVAKTPYFDEQVEWLVECADQQRTPLLRRAVTASVGLGLGAGLRTSELNAVRANDIHAERGHLVVEVLGRNRRTIPIVDRFAPLVTQLVDAHPGEPLVHRHGFSRVEALAAALGRAEVPQELKPLRIVRLRATWAVTMLNSRIPFAAVQAAYGATGIEFVYDLLPHLRAPEWGQQVDMFAKPLT